MPWYSYVSGDPGSASSYVYAGTAQPSCVAGPLLCAIYAAYNTTNNQFPAPITTELYADIKAALENAAHRGSAYVKL